MNPKLRLIKYLPKIFSRFKPLANNESPKFTSSIPSDYKHFFDSSECQNIKIKNIFICSVQNAPNHCLGPKHPMVLAQMKGCVGWIHFVRTNTHPGLEWTQKTSEGWIFVDINPSQYISKSPLYTKGDTFFDNPLWSRPPSGFLSWEGLAFPLLKSHGRIEAANGFRWGFIWASDKEKPQAFPISPVAAEEYKKMKSLFINTFSFPL